ncbi:mitotic deacetylase-associated SANT domain protein isoform X2 [Stegostoma tigrinum]|uniref:mitotic deacetylase-associated SANT domain protein isoform X2 n=1 Tax=Stegostoma tigrinum TaxID=3053191 RepID=UPI00287092A8|nr:mitotic deacetylase-associated SANT domain protein isoform X2 [Stegostoma tigrinum]
MNVQAPGKSSAKRKGKQISFFGENTGTVQSSPSHQRKNGMIHSEAESGPLKSQPPVVPETPARSGQCQSVGSDLGMSQERAAAAGSTMPANWAASVLIDRLPSKGSFSWQPAGSWTQSAAPFCASVGAVSIIDSNATGPFSHALAKQGATAQLQKQQHQQMQHPLQQQQQNQLQQRHLQSQQSNQLQQKQHQLQQQHAQSQQSNQHQRQQQHAQSQQSNQHQLQQQHAQSQQSNQLQQKQHQLQQQHAQSQQSNQHQLQQQHTQSQQSNQQQPTQCQQSNQLQQKQHQLQQQHAQSQQSNQHQLQQQHAQSQQSNQHQLQQQHAQTQQQNQLQHQLQQQYQQNQLLHQHQQQQSNEGLPQRQFFQYPYSQNQKQELPPNSVLNIFHQVHQPPLLPLYSHQAQTTCQQHLFQQFFPHQQPPQSLGLQRVQMSQGSDPSMHHIVSTAAPFQQQPPEVHVSKGLQRFTLGGNKQEHCPRQLTLEFQAPPTKRAQHSFKERNAKPPLFEPHRVGNPPGSTESTSQCWPQAYGPELQKLLNVPPNHCGQNQLKLFEAGSLQPKGAQAHGLESWSQEENSPVSQEIREPVQEATSRDEGPADSLVPISVKKGRTCSEANGLQPQQESTEGLSNWTTSAKLGENNSQEERNSLAAGHSKVPAVPASSRGRLDDSCLLPLVIPVSVPVRKMDPVTTSTDKKEDGESQGNLANERDLSELNQSLLPTRRRRLSRGSGTEHSVQENASSRGHVNLTAKLKRRPRPEPLFIPPKPLNHVSVITYPPGTLYQSNLRSPVRLLDHPMDKNFQPPPYTPPPILSPMREGSGLYFNAFLSSSSNSSQPVTPRSTPKASLSQSNSADTPPPVLSLMNEATPASIEPRINIGPQFQAEIPGLRDGSLAAADASHADLVFKPWEGHKTNRLNQQSVDDLMTLACSSILPGGGTNQELTLHCLHESKGNILGALNMLLIKKTPRGRNKALLNYHYAGSDKWTPTEKKMFNKGLAAHKKDFFLVQKLVKTKTVAQCVEFYYTYKKQVKIGRNGTLIFGDASDNKCEEEPVEIDRKDSHPRRARTPYITEVKKEEDNDEEEEEEEEDREQEDDEEAGPDHKKLTLTQTKLVKTDQTPVASQGVHLRKNPDPTYRCSYRPRQPAASTTPPRMPSRSEQAQSGVSAKHAKQSQENIFPCKKCGKVFFKVKSRSAHMKSHSVQEKKQREAELRSRVMADEQREEQENYDDFSDSYQDE